MKSFIKTHAMPFNVLAFLTETDGLTPAQVGAYGLSLMAYWLNDGPIGVEYFRAICGEESERVARFYKVSGNMMRHKRLDAQLAKEKAL